MRLRTVGDLVQERFAKPLAQDRLCSLVEPAMLEARLPEGGKTFTHFDRALRPLTATPTGVGLDVPQWLRRLKQEVDHVRESQTSIAVLAEGLLQVPQKDLSLEELRKLIEEWQ